MFRKATQNSKDSKVKQRKLDRLRQSGRLAAITESGNEADLSWLSSVFVNEALWDIPLWQEMCKARGGGRTLSWSLSRRSFPSAQPLKLQWVKAPYPRIQGRLLYPDYHSLLSSQRSIGIHGRGRKEWWKTRREGVFVDCLGLFSNPVLILLYYYYYYFLHRWQIT